MISIPAWKKRDTGWHFVGGFLNWGWDFDYTHKGHPGEKGLFWSRAL